MDAKFHRMFSVPVLQTAPYKFSKEELDIVRNEKNNIMDNVGKNVSTTDTSVFKKLPKMYEFCNYHLQYYIRELIKVIPDIEFYITQSWINFNPKGSFHHTHYHPNSLISGVLGWNTILNKLVPKLIRLYRSPFLVNNKFLILALA